MIGVEIRLGDFADKPPSVKLLVSDSSMLTRLRLKSLTEVAVHSEQTDDGYLVRIRIPWLLLSSEFVPPSAMTTILGFLAKVIDVDNEFRPEETTVFANAMWKPTMIATEGELALVPQGEQFGSVEYVHAGIVIEQLRRRGF
jgi:hypothetical protein